MKETLLVPMCPRRVCLAFGLIATVGVALAHDGHGINLDPGPDGPQGVYPAQNVAYIGRIALDEFGPVSYMSGADCWGYTSPSGREYALMCLSAALAVVEITDPANPDVVAVIDHPENDWADVKVINGYAYVSTEHVAGSIQIIDLNNVDNGFAPLVGAITDIPITRAHNVISDTVNQRLYLCGARNGTAFIANGGLLCFDVANPLDPQFLGAYGDTYVHDAQIVTFTEGPNAGKQIAFCASATVGFEVVDFTNNASPFRVSRTPYAGLAYSHQCWYDETSGMVYLNDELDESEGLVGVTTTRVFDVSNLAAPVLAGTFTSGVNSIDHNLYARDGFIFEANYRSGLRIFDARTDPEAPVQVGFFDTYPSSDSIDFSGAWSVYPYFASGVVIVSDINRGLFILDPTYALTGGAPFAYEFPGGIPETLPPAGASIEFRLVGTNGGQASPDDVWLVLGDHHHRHGGATVQAEHLGGEDYRVTLPPGTCGERLSYYFVAYDPQGVAVLSPFSSPIVGEPAAPYEAHYADALLATFADDMEAEGGWTVEPEAADPASSGTWVRVDPVGTSSAGRPIQPEDDFTEDPGSVCWVTGQQAVGDTNIGANDIDNGGTVLLSPTMDALGGDEPTLHYHFWYVNDGNTAVDDVFNVDISNDGGQSWTPLETVSVSTAGWEHREIAVADFVIPTDQVRLRFTARDTGAGSIVEAAVDDVEIVVIECLGVFADLNGDGAVDTADLGLLIAAFGQPAAGGPDLNGDGLVDTADLGLLIAAFSPPD